MTLLKNKIAVERSNLQTSYEELSLSGKILYSQFHRFLSGIHRNLYRKSTEKAVEAVGNDVSLNH